MQAIDEYNSYGQAIHSKRVRINPVTASTLYGFSVPSLPMLSVFVSTPDKPSCLAKVGVAPEAWVNLERHLHQFKPEKSGQAEKRERITMRLNPI